MSNQPTLEGRLKHPLTNTLDALKQLKRNVVITELAEKIMNDDEELFFNINGKEYCNEERILSILLKNEILFCNSRHYSFGKDRKSEGETLVLFVICNDIFCWACADAEDITTNEIPVLYRMWEKDKVWGPIKWCCLKRNEKPQQPVEDSMKENGVWDDVMEKLPENKAKGLGL